MQNNRTSFLGRIPVTARVRAMFVAMAAMFTLSIAAAALADDAVTPARPISIGGGPINVRPRFEPGTELTISVLTFGPGDHPFYKFGHNAILIHDDLRMRDDVYNFGTFNFESPTLIRDFLGGTPRVLAICSKPGVDDAPLSCGK